ncbi:hypothetical protein [Anaeromyxobacter paludicola]|uniref:Uncharacterized protein n=1 Tax=Anaeromyxobacter paludicola TaxID=2918171 RepID=A0ABM7X559_9BACT|nr:hypothetical protein [Anaeromyxobacter paludicola]BDG06951.1 hypothetical protein AMPC_00640 [Anaeromyxobacter paludicola]
MPDAAALAALEAEGILERREGRLRTTRRWQAAMARAALRLQLQGAPWNDLRLPIALGLAELEGDLPDAELARRAEALLPLERGELGAAFGDPGAAPG